MNQTNGGSENDSDRVEVVVDIFSHNPEQQKGEYKILTGENIPAEGEIGIEPGMTIHVKDIEENEKIPEEIVEQILKNKKARKTRSSNDREAR